MPLPFILAPHQLGPYTSVSLCPESTPQALALPPYPGPNLQSCPYPGDKD